MTQTVRNENSVAHEEKLYMAMEMSNKHWKLGLSCGQSKLREYTVSAGDWSRLEEVIVKAKKRFSLPAQAQVLSCYEAGRDGFWPHRELTRRGIHNVVVDPSSMQVDRRARRSKTDRIDVLKLNQHLMRYHQGDRGVWSVVAIPSEEQEDARRLHRELDRLKKERGAHSARIRSLLKLHGIDLGPGAKLDAQLGKVRGADGKGLPSAIQSEVVRENRRWQLAHDQINELEREQRALLKQEAKKSTPSPQPSSPSDKVLQLLSLRGIGATGAWVMVHEVMGWRNYRNRREAASCIGLVPTPFQSGAMSREQGISKAGNARVRGLLVELSWKWLSYQPESKLSTWYEQTFAKRGGRVRRVGIVALARRLWIALWRFVEFGEVPEGAKLKTPAQLKAAL